ncbi:YtxH domain-containing protein [uncultured Pontibacter sp.]|uniref:YtxH domain-containing protein n=1 Tax=uncultured Pontibacter sp. TaxID=453356 RepID=UPI00262D595A|nr:YtxH domain-containing protein [uncultured Pontibacter sp.]
MKDNSGKVLLAMLAGASAGVIAGLLMAPDTGEVTRSSVKKWAGKMSKDLEKNLQDGLEEIKKMSGDTFGKSAEGNKGGNDNTGTSASSGSSSASAGSATTGGSSATGSTGGNA